MYIKVAMVKSRLNAVSYSNAFLVNKKEVECLFQYDILIFLVLGYSVKVTFELNVAVSYTTTV